LACPRQPPSQRGVSVNNARFQFYLPVFPTSLMSALIRITDREPPYDNAQ
jgi:hypothetical protein